MASRGKLLPALLDALLAEPYFRQAPPKSAGREQYGRAYVEKILAWGRRRRARPEDLVRTATMLTALSIAAALNRWVALPARKGPGAAAPEAQPAATNWASRLRRGTQPNCPSGSGHCPHNEACGSEWCAS